MRLIKPAVSLATAALLVAAAACGGDDEGSEVEGFNQEEGGAAGKAIIHDASDPSGLADAPAPEVEGAQEGGKVTFVTSVAPHTLDPTRAYFTDSGEILSSLVIRSLTMYKQDGEGGMVLVPDLAKTVGEPNEDNTEWTWELKEGIKYEDGTPITAEDVAYAVKRSFAIEELPDGPIYNTQFFLDGNTYKGPYEDGLDYDGVSVDGNSITIKMRRPFADMPYLASFPQFSPIPQDKDTDPLAYERHPMATGPYKFVEYKPGSSLLLERNEHWDPNTDPARHQYLDEIEFEFAEDQTKFENVIIEDQGDAQTTLTYDNLLPSNYKRLSDSGELEERTVEGPGNCTFIGYIDMRKITDIKVRQAIGYAYPYEDAWQAGGEIVGVTRIPSETLLPIGTDGRLDYESPLGNGGVEQDLDKARQLLQEADAVGTELTWYFASDDEAAVAQKDERVKAFEAAGFTTNPIASTSETLRDDRNRDDEQNIRFIGWCSDWPNGASWFPAQWDGELVGQPGMPNPSNIDEPEINKEIDRILNTLDGEEAADAWGELDQLMFEKYYPAVLEGYNGNVMVFGSRVGGVYYEPTRGLPGMTDLYVIQ